MMQMFSPVFQVKDLLWSSDSSVLAVWLEDMAVGADKQVNTCSKFCPKGDKNVHVTKTHLIMTRLLHESSAFELHPKCF